MTKTWMIPAAATLALTACGRGGPAPEATAVRGQPAELVLASGARYEGVAGMRPRASGPTGHDIELRLSAARGFVPAHAFCDVYVEAACGSLTACGCEEDKVSCHADAREACAGEWGLYGPQVQAAVDADRLVYDGFAAYRFLEALGDATEACAQPLEALDMDRAALLGFFDVFHGYVRPGQACTLPFLPFRANECAGGLCVDQGDGAGPSCVAVADLGDACGADTVCVDLAQPVEMRDLFDGTLLGRCAPVAGGEMVCQPRVKDGGKCAFDLDCASTWCQAERCAPRAQPGEQCRSDLDCAAGLCALGLCADPRLPLDAECGHHDACESGACYRGRCAESLCRR